MNNFVKYLPVLFLSGSFPAAQLPVVAFNVNNLPFTEPMLSIWAQLVNLAGSKIEKHRMKSPNQGLSGTVIFAVVVLKG